MYVISCFTLPFPIWSTVISSLPLEPHVINGRSLIPNEINQRNNNDPLKSSFYLQLPIKHGATISIVDNYQNSVWQAVATTSHTRVKFYNFLFVHCNFVPHFLPWLNVRSQTLWNIFMRTFYSEGDLTENTIHKMRSEKNKYRATKVRIRALI